MEADLKELVKLRNQVAKGLGFSSYHALQLHLNEQSQDAVIALFDELDALTRGPFLKAKAEIDTRLAKTYGIAPREIRPWHVHDPFFQETPAVFDTDLDAAYKNADILRLCREFYAGIGLPIEDVIRAATSTRSPAKAHMPSARTSTAKETFAC